MKAKPQENQSRVIKLSSTPPEFLEMRHFIDAGIPENVIAEFVKYRQKKGSPLTRNSAHLNLNRALEAEVKIGKEKLTPGEIVAVTMELQWLKIEESWIQGRIDAMGTSKFRIVCLDPAREKLGLNASRAVTKPNLKLVSKDKKSKQIADPATDKVKEIAELVPDNPAVNNLIKNHIYNMYWNDINPSSQYSSNLIQDTLGRHKVQVTKKMITAFVNQQFGVLNQMFAEKKAVELEKRMTNIQDFGAFLTWAFMGDRDGHEDMKAYAKLLRFKHLDGSNLYVELSGDAKWDGRRIKPITKRLQKYTGQPLNIVQFISKEETAQIATIERATVKQAELPIDIPASFDDFSPNFEFDPKMYDMHSGGQVTAELKEMWLSMSEKVKPVKAWFSSLTKRMDHGLQQLSEKAFGHVKVDHASQSPSLTIQQQIDEQRSIIEVLTNQVREQDIRLMNQVRKNFILDGKLTALSNAMKLKK